MRGNIVLLGILSVLGALMMPGHGSPSMVTAYYEETITITPVDGSTKDKTYMDIHLASYAITTSFPKTPPCASTCFGQRQTTVYVPLVVTAPSSCMDQYTLTTIVPLSYNIPPLVLATASIISQITYTATPPGQDVYTGVDIYLNSGLVTPSLSSEKSKMLSLCYDLRSCYTGLEVCTGTASELNLARINSGYSEGIQWRLFTVAIANIMMVLL